MTQKDLKEFINKMQEFHPIAVKHFQIGDPNKFFGFNITLQQYLALDILVSRNKCKMTDLSKDLGIKLSTATGLVDRLIKRHFAKRERDTEDRRLVWIYPTQTGIKIDKKIKEIKENHVSKILRKITQNDRDNLIRIIEKITKVVKELGEK